VDREKFRILLNDFSELQDDDASLSLGHFEFRALDFRVSFYEDRKCMVFLTLSALLDFLLGDLKVGSTYKWVGDGNGTMVLINVVDIGRLEFLVDTISVHIDIDEFINAICAELDLFLPRCIILNSKILNESGFLMLKTSFENLKNGRAS